MTSPKTLICPLAGGLLALSLAACSSAPAPGGMRASASAPLFQGRQATDYFATRQSPSHIERCLKDNLSSVRAMRGEPVTLLIGPGPIDADWVITLGNNGHGTNLSMYRPTGGDGTTEESELRYNLARCAT